MHHSFQVCIVPYTKMLRSVQRLKPPEEALSSLSAWGEVVTAGKRVNCHMLVVVRSALALQQKKKWIFSHS